MVSGIPRKECEMLLRNIFRARLFDDKVQELCQKGIIKNAGLSHRGQEAGPTALCALLKKNDILIPPYRGYAHTISKGLPLKDIAAEILGKKTGPTKGIGNRG